MIDPLFMNMSGQPNPYVDQGAYGPSRATLNAAAAAQNNTRDPSKSNTGLQVSGVPIRDLISNTANTAQPRNSSSNFGSTAAGFLGGLGAGAAGLLGGIGSGIGKGISNFLGGLSMEDIANAGLGAGALAAIYKGYDDLGDIGDTAYTRAGDIAQQGLEQTQFKPFTVRSSTGGMFSANEGGNVGMTLSPQEQAIQNALMTQAQQGITAGFTGDPMQQAASEQAYGLGGQFMDMAGQDPMQRERDIYGDIRAMQSPEEERQRMALEERLFAQGRGGVSTNMYGGTPEQLAMSKAQAEAQNQASLMAMQQAQAEQRQQADIGSTFAGLGSTLGARDYATRQLQQQLAFANLTGAYAPQNQLLELQQASQLYPQLAQRAQLQGAGLFGEASMGGLEAYLGAGLGRANLLGTLGSGLLSGIFK